MAFRLEGKILQENGFAAKFVELLEKFATQRHVLALRDGMLGSVPIILLGSTFLLLGAQSEVLTQYFGGGVSWLPNIVDSTFGRWYLANSADFYIPYRLTMGLLGIYIAFTVAAALAKQYELPPIPQGLGAMAALLVTEAPEKVSFVEGVGWAIPLKPFGPEGIFLGIISAFFVVEISRLFILPGRSKAVQDDVGRSIPPAVAEAFGSFLPMLLAVCSVWIVSHVCDLNINKGIMLLMSPLSSMGDSLAAVEASNFFLHLFAVAGIHGISVINAVMLPLWQQFVAANAEAHSAGLPLPHVTAYPFYQWFIWIGGSGATLAPTCLLFLFKKNVHFRKVGKMAIVPALFNVNEPFLFGLPVIANPVLAVPCIIAPMICGAVAWFAVSRGLVGAPFIEVPWVMPGFLGAILSTQDWRSLILFVVNFVISGFIWLPFLRYTDRKMLNDRHSSDSGAEADEVKK
ncbi:MAG: PTS sugar transporter subunit IIC [Candidatus Bruticola sp.]